MAEFASVVRSRFPRALGAERCARVSTGGGERRGEAILSCWRQPASGRGYPRLLAATEVRRGFPQLLAAVGGGENVRVGCRRPSGAEEFLSCRRRSEVARGLPQLLAAASGDRGYPQLLAAAGGGPIISLASQGGGEDMVRGPEGEDILG